MTRRPQRGDGNTVFGTADVEYGMTASPQVKAPEKVDIYAAALDVHTALNTYEVAADVPAGVTLTTPDTLVVVGANRRRLVARWTPEGVWLGGCLIADEVVALALAAFITREDEGA